MRIVLVLLLLACGVVGVASYYAYSKVSYQPDWYTTSGPMKWSVPRAEAQLTVRRLSRELETKGATRVSQQDLPALLSYALSEVTDAPIDSLVKGIRTRIDAQGGSVEMMVDMQQLAATKLPSTARGLLDKAKSMLPKSALNDVFVQLALPPGGDLGALRRGAALQIGQLPFSMSELQEGMDSKLSAMQARMEGELGKLQLDFDDSGVGITR